MAEFGGYTCIACRVVFADVELQRGHYKSDWHRYNLKRRIAELPPVTAENFQERVLAQRAQQADLEKEKEVTSYCNPCNKTFNSKNAYENHVKSKKHKDACAKQQQKLQEEVAKRNEKNREKGLESSPEEEKRWLKDAQNEALKASSGNHGLPESKPTTSGSKSHSAGDAGTVPCTDQEMDTEMESDGESVESWSGDSLGVEECLFCSHVSKSLEENIEHMFRTHSFFIPDLEYIIDLDGLITYLGEKVGEGHICLWCDEKSKAYLTTKAVQQHMLDKGHCKMLFEGDSVFEYSDFYDYRKSYPDYEEGAEVSEDMEVDREVVDPQLLLEENYQLILPSGSSVGHRSLQRYYRQKLKPDRPQRPNAVTRVMAQYRALGWTGTTGLSAQRRAKDIQYVQRLKSRHYMKMAQKNNMMQKYFRDDNFGIKKSLKKK